MGLKDRLIALLGGQPASVRLTSTTAALPASHPIAKLLLERAAKGVHTFDKDSADGRAIAEWLASQRAGNAPPPQTPEQAAALQQLGHDNAGNHLEWAIWDRESRILVADLPGWSPCRFYNRIGPSTAMGVFGAVKGLFGIWRQPYNVCDGEHDEQGEVVLPAVTHLATGLAMGTFVDVTTAAKASEVLSALDWASMPPADPDEKCRAAWAERAGLARKTLAFHGIVPQERRHAHERGDPYMTLIPIYAVQDLGTDKPEKLS